MTFRDLIMAPARRFAPEGEGAGGAGAAGGGAGGGAAEKWWQGADYSDEERQWLTARGLTEDDPAKVVPKLVKGHRAAEQRLGRGVDSVIDRPKDGQTLADWMREQKDVFGLPAAEADYKLDRPKDLPESVAWNGDLEAKARKVAFDQGMTGGQLQAMTELYAGVVSDMGKQADAEFAAANQQMMAALERDWGKETPARLAQARQAAGVLAEKAGLDAAGIEAVSSVLSLKAGGDAAAIRMFAALGEMMGEDRLVAGSGTSGLGLTPVEARARAAQMRSPDGAWAKAVASNDRAEIARLRPEIERLDKIGAGL